MDKYIEYDLENGEKQLKCGICNVLNAISSRKISEYEFKDAPSLRLIYICAVELDWIHIKTLIDSINYHYYMTTPSGDLVIFTGGKLGLTPIKIYISDTI